MTNTEPNMTILRSLCLIYIIIISGKCADSNNNTFQCTEKCIPLNMKCNDIKECLGGEDESECQCKKNIGILKGTMPPPSPDRIRIRDEYLKV